MSYALLLEKSAYTWYLFDFSTPFSIFMAVAIWLTIALVLAFVVAMLTLKGGAKAIFFKVSRVFTICYAVALSVTFLGFELSEMGKNGEFLLILFLPISLFIVAIGGSAVALCVKKTKPVVVACAIACGLAMVAVIVCLAVHFASGDAAEMNWITNEQVEGIALILSAVVATALVVLVAFLCDKGDKGFDTKSISYASVCIAMSFALSYLRIVKMPQGGSITIASLLPLMIYSYMFGTKKGLFAGMVYGLLQALQDPYIIHPAQFILDYPVAFACIGLSGIFAKNEKLASLPQISFALGAILAGLMRFAMHYLSGVFAFSAFAGGQNPYIYSLGYQAAYVFPDIAIAVAVGILVFSSPSFIKQIIKREHV